MIVSSATCLVLLGLSLSPLVAGNPQGWHVRKANIYQDRVAKTPLPQSEHCLFTPFQLPSTINETPHMTLTVRVLSSTGDLPPPSSGLKVKDVVIGMGVQNYVCDTSKPDTAPTGIGAVATLHSAALLAPNENRVRSGTVATFLRGTTIWPEIGTHRFVDGNPFFDLGDRGRFNGDKNKVTGVPAPRGSVPKADEAVNWLRLEDGGNSVNYKEVYRVNTNGGKPPATCKDQPGQIEVKYTATYYFYG
ncbi:MAG: hypothetical protein M1815_004121 [Lichina confinis]|nr:MAG: hypothetical protein M1815_004121 [Lichina confinis]